MRLNIGRFKGICCDTDEASVRVDCLTSLYLQTDLLPCTVNLQHHENNRVTNCQRCYMLLVAGRHQYQGTCPDYVPSSIAAAAPGTTIYSQSSMGGWRGGVGKLGLYITIYLKTYYTHLLCPAHAAWPWHGARYVLNQLYILYCTAALLVQLTSCMYSASNSSPFEQRFDVMKISLVFIVLWNLYMKKLHLLLQYSTWFTAFAHWFSLLSPGILI